MSVSTPFARAAITSDPHWNVALTRALNEIAGIRPDALFVFANHRFSPDFPAILAEVLRATRTPILIGCSGTGIIGMDRELEHQPAIALLALSLPGAQLSTARFTQGMIDASADGSGWQARTGIDPGETRGWIVFGDPFRIDGDGLVRALEGAYPGIPVVGGFASPGPEDRRTWVFHNSEIHQDGAVGLAIGGEYELQPIVSQGCDPIGQAWTVTAVQSHWIETISNRPAVQVLVETLNSLPEDIRPQAQKNLLAGLAADEYRHEYLRGDFLVRNITGVDQASGAIALAATPRVGQTIQFQLRDAATADLDLNILLEHAKLRFGGRKPVATLLCTCNGRGVGLFGTPHHDAMTFARKLHQGPLAGLFCAGEIGPIGGKNHIHGFTASAGLILPSPSH